MQDKNNSNDSKYLYLTAGIIGLGISSYFILRGKSKKAPSQIKEGISDFEKNFSPNELAKIKYVSDKFRKYNVYKQIEGSSDFKYFAAAKKAGIKVSNKINAREINFIKVQNVNPQDQNNLFTILTHSVDGNYRHLKFTEDNFNTIQDSLKKMPTNTYIFMENFKEYINRKGSLPPKLNYFTIDNESPINLIAKGKLDLSEDLNAYNAFTAMGKKNPNLEEIENELCKIFEKIPLELRLLLQSKLLQNKSGIISIGNSVGENVEKESIQKFSTSIKRPFFSVNNKTFEADLKPVVDYQNSTGEKALVFIENELKAEQFKKLFNFDSIIVGKNLPEYSVKVNLQDKFEQNIQTSIENIDRKLKAIKTLYFPDKDVFTKSILYPLSIRNIDGKLSQPLRGILLKGNDKLSKKALKQISEITDIPIKTVDFSDFSSGINVLCDGMQKNKRQYLYDLVNTEHVLCNYKNNLDNTILIGKFKNIIENEMEKNSSTAILRTNKPLEQFEPASIAGHRFNVEVKIGEKKNENISDTH